MRGIPTDGQGQQHARSDARAHSCHEAAAGVSTRNCRAACDLRARKSPRNASTFLKGLFWKFSGQEAGGGRRQVLEWGGRRERRGAGFPLCVSGGFSEAADLRGCASGRGMGTPPWSAHAPLRAAPRSPGSGSRSCWGAQGCFRWQRAPLPQADTRSLLLRCCGPSPRPVPPLLRRRGWGARAGRCAQRGGVPLSHARPLRQLEVLDSQDPSVLLP